MKLIDADKVVDFARKEMITPITRKEYENGITAAGGCIVAKINNGDFDPPKFSAEAVDYCRRFMDSPKFGIEYKDLPELIDHLIQYLEQLRDTK